MLCVLEHNLLSPTTYYFLLPTYSSRFSSVSQEIHTTMDIFFEWNLCKIFFVSLTLFIVILGILVNICEPCLPVFMTRTFKYGKFACKKDSYFAKKIEVPKSYFKHFYLTAVIIYFITFVEVISAYVFDSDVPRWLVALLDLTCGQSREARVSVTRVFSAVILLVLQVCRRFFDTHFISVFSKHATMNLSHYLIGLLYYPAVMLVVLSEAPKFTHESTNSRLQLNGIGPLEILAVIIFMWAWYHQHTTTVILANLRKNRRGETVSQSYKIPKGDWFNYVSSPHCTAEIIMYTCLSVILADNISWWFVYAWVVSNQIETMLLSHWWYQSNFKDFPAKRKAVIPFIY